MVSVKVIHVLSQHYLFSLFPKFSQPLLLLNMKVIELEHSHVALTTIMTTLQANLTKVKDIVSNLAMDLGHLLKDPEKPHEGETIDESTLGQISSQSPYCRRLYS